jgi:hypothetical protein
MGLISAADAKKALNFEVPVNHPAVNAARLDAGLKAIRKRVEEEIDNAIQRGRNSAYVTVSTDAFKDGREQDPMTASAAVSKLVKELKGLGYEVHVAHGKGANEWSEHQVSISVSFPE